MQCFCPYCTCCVRLSMCWFAVSYSDIAFDVIYFNLSPLDYTEPHSETWIWSRLIPPSPLLPCEKTFLRWAAITCESWSVSHVNVLCQFHSAQLSLPKLSSCRTPDGDRGDPNDACSKSNNFTWNEVQIEPHMIIGNIIYSLTVSVTETLSALFSMMHN